MSEEETRFYVTVGDDDFSGKGYFASDATDETAARAIADEQAPGWIDFCYREMDIRESFMCQYHGALW